MNQVKSGKPITITLDSGDWEFIATGLRDNAAHVREFPAGTWDTPEEQEQCAKGNEELADKLYEHVMVKEHPEPERKRITLCIDVDQSNVATIEEYLGAWYNQFHFGVAQYDSNPNWDVCIDNIKEEEEHTI